MTRRANTTIIVVGGDQLARFDFDGTDHPVQRSEWRADRLAGRSLRDAVRLAIASNARCGRNVWILVESLWTQALTLPTAAVANMGPEELERALSFELESLSGVSAADSVVGHFRLETGEDVTTYWITQARHSVCDDLRRMIREAGGRLQGLLHPAGVPRALSNNSGGKWSRVEVWGDVTLCQHGDGDIVERHFIDGGPSRDHWRSSVAAWLEDIDAERVELLNRGRPSRELVSTASEAPIPERLNTVVQLEGDALASWAAAWASVLEGHGCPVPFVRPTAEPPSVRRSVVAGLVTAALIAMACGVHGWRMWESVEKAQAVAAELERPRRELTELDRRIAQLGSEIQSASLHIRSQPNTEDPTAVLIRQKARLSALLDSLGRLSSSDRVIKALRAEDHGAVTIEGLSLTPEAADALAIGLTGELSSHGWRLGGAEKSAQRTCRDGGPWSFSILLTPNVPVITPDKPSVDADPPVLVASEQQR